MGLDMFLFKVQRERVGYWRKANAIHRWFVENVQKGDDDCRAYDVDREQLEALLKLCTNIRDGKADPEEALPTQGGFFFGDTDYGEGYMTDIDDTIELLERVLAENDEDALFQYTSWW